MKEDDDFLKRFFDEMKKGDELLETPSLAKLLPTKTAQTMPGWAVIAATINIIFFIGGFWYLSHQAPDNGASKLVEDEIDMMNWSTPSDQLLSNF